LEILPLHRTTSTHAFSTFAFMCATLPIDVLEFIRIALFQWVFFLGCMNQGLVCLRLWLDRTFERHWVANSPRLKLDLGFHHPSVSDDLGNVENSEGLCDGDEQRVIGYVSTWANSTPVAKDAISRIRLSFVGRRLEMALWSEDHWVWVDFRVVCKMPVVRQENRALWDTIASTRILLCAAMRKTHGQHEMPAMCFFHHSLDVGKLGAISSNWKTVLADLAIDFLGCFGLDIWENSHGEEKSH
jgi:hypothetical protein